MATRYQYFFTSGRPIITWVDARGAKRWTEMTGTSAHRFREEVARTDALLQTLMREFVESGEDVVQ